MRIKSPVGEYDYRVTAVRRKGTNLEVDGSLGMWDTTMVLEPGDLTPVVKGLALLAAVALVVRLRPLSPGRDRRARRRR
jgi:hypothetical protein